MHEMAIAQGMLDIAHEELASHGCARLTLVRVDVGVLSGVVPDCLEQAFEALTRGTQDEGARIEIVRVPLRLRCVCGKEFASSGSPMDLPACPDCGEVFGHAVLSGKEMQISWIEGE